MQASSGLFRPPPPSIYAPPSPSSRRLPPIRRATTRIRSSSSIKSEPTSSTITTTKTATEVKLTYLEFNGWLWELDGSRFRVLVDPLLVGNLDFGMPPRRPSARTASKTSRRTSPSSTCSSSPRASMTTATSAPSHASPPSPQTSPSSPRPTRAPSSPPLPSTTSPTSSRASPPPSAPPPTPRSRYLPPVNGPPWQRPENSYIVTTAGEGQRKHSVYYEPHCMYDAGFLRDRGLRADVPITPVVKQQLLASFTLVSGQEDAVELARLLGAAYVVPMNNGECDAKGLLTAVISTQGTTHAFKDLLADALPQTQVVEPTPGVPLHLHFNDDNKTSSPSSSSS